MVASEQIPRDPFRAVKQQRDTAKGKRVFSPDEIERLLAACLMDRWRLYVMLAATTAMRRGEILNLTVREIDYAAGVITISPKADSAQTWAWQIKDRESRSLPITGATEQMLLRLHARLPDAQPYISISPQRYRRLIVKRDRLAAAGKPLPSTFSRCPILNFNRDWRGICDRAGVAYRPFHALRGSALSIMAQNGLQPHEVQAIGGHADVRTTYRHYVRPLDHVNNARLAVFQPQSQR
jgi:integrase